MNIGIKQYLLVIDVSKLNEIEKEIFGRISILMKDAFDDLSQYFLDLKLSQFFIAE